jgi:cytidine deaminase
MAYKGKECMKTSNQTIRLHQTAKEFRKRAYAPYSKFKVGAGLRATSGKVFGGCNIENASYGGAVCAERTAILKAVSAGERKFSEIVIVTDSDKPAVPCALCLQTMAEFFAPETRVLIANQRKIVSEHLFKDLLPLPFGPKQLDQAR